MTRIVIDDEQCILAGECIYNHPEHFAWNDEGTAVVVIRPEIATEADQRHADEAVALCPSGAISIVRS